MLFSYIVGHDPVNFCKKILKNEKVMKKYKSKGFFTHPLVKILTSYKPIHCMLYFSDTYATERHRKLYCYMKISNLHSSMATNN